MTARQRKLSPEEARRKALELWERGWVSWRRHAAGRARRRDFSDADVEHVLSTGEVSGNPRWDEGHKNWEYVAQGTDLEGDRLAIVFAFEEEFTELFLITGKDW